MKNKVLLINPRFPEEISLFNFPVSLLCIGSWIKREGYEVTIIDALHYKSSKDVLLKIEKELDGCLCVGLSVMSAQIPSALEISKFIRQKDSSIPIVWGGIHPTLYSEQTAKSDLVDFVIKGEGEITFSDLLKAIKLKDLYPKYIDGIAFKDNGEVVITKDREILSLDNMPAIDLDLIKSLKPNSSLKEISELAEYGLPILTSKGCPHKCTFCINSILKEKFRYRSISKVLEDIKQVLNLGVERIWFMDETFFVSKNRIVEFISDIESESLKFEWFAAVRADYFRPDYLGSKELLQRIKNSGCTAMGAGAESGSQRILDKVKKDITIKDTLNMTQCLSNVGIGAPFSFMIGLPNEEEEDYKKTLKLIREITKISNKHWILGPQIYRPYPGSELYNECIEQGLKDPKTIEEWAESPYIHAEFAKKQYFSKKLYPWVKYNGDLTNLVFYASLMGVKPERKLVTWILRFIGRTRCRVYFFKFPITKMVYGFLRGSKLEALLRE